MGIRLAGIALLAILAFSCGESSDSIQKNSGGPSNENVAATPPQIVDGLEVKLIANTSDAGEHSLRIEGELLNTADANGVLWSSIFGNRFSITIGPQKFELVLPEGKELDPTAKFSLQADLPRDQANLYFQKELKLFPIDSLSHPQFSTDSATTPPSLVDFQKGFAVFDDYPGIFNRRILNCQRDPSQPKPVLPWENSTSGMVAFALSTPDGRTYQNVSSTSGGAPDSGSWKLPKELFLSLFDNGERSSAEEPDEDGISSFYFEKPVDLTITRMLKVQTINVIHPNLDRTLKIYAKAVHHYQAILRFNGGCGA